MSAMAHNNTTRKPGRPYKGPRDSGFMVRPHILVGQAIRDNWEVAGYDSMGDYIAAIVAHHEGLPQYAPQPRPRTTDSGNSL